MSVLAGLVLLFSALAAPTPAAAASNYDDLIHVEESLYVYTDGSTKNQTMNVDSTWWTDFKESYIKKSSLTPGRFPASFIVDFENILANGSWIVFSEMLPAGRTISFAGTSDPNASCAFTGPNEINAFQCSSTAGSLNVSVDYFTHSSYGGNGCSSSTCSANGMNFYADPIVRTSTTSDPTFVNILNMYTKDRFEFYLGKVDVEYPTGYAGDIIPQQINLGNYVALGDSFSSGEGVEPFITGTDEGAPNENRCHRSLGSYPALLAGNTFQQVRFDDSTFVACSGATTSNITTSGQWGEPRQLDAVNVDTDAVTLTIGGNDAGFSDILTDCTQSAYGIKPGWGCSKESSTIATITHRLNALNGSVVDASIHPIEDVLLAITASAPSAKIRIIGYPHLFGGSITNYDPDALAPGGARCVVAWWAGIVSISYEDAQWINSQSDALNDILSEAASNLATDGHDIDFVAPETFSGHGLCDNEDPYINPLYLYGDVTNPNVTAKSFHPTNEGIKAYKNIVELTF